MYDDMKLRAYPDGQASRFFYFGRLPDYVEMTFMHRYLRPGDGFIDGGANEGVYTLLAAKLVGSSGEVHAFEAVPLYLARLRGNIRVNHLTMVTVHSAAIGAKPGQMPFVLRGVGSRIQTREDRASDVSTVDVDVVRLDDALPDREWAMGKLDIEGAEHQALAGAEKLLARGEPAVWMLELVDRFLLRFGSTVTEVREWLADYGYDFMYYEPGHNGLVTSPRSNIETPNVLVVSRERRAEVEARLNGAR
ncbi:FkbM family methyltransferase [Nonomuraea sp. SYSU D8015]|uniref:FkbM family methyltransferase n=1 Tax=Nonomuraea sp. SYSU D8015 TaxID=2593644 RepID=UPI0016606D56|nr:FkbM family methyltransferase [Nonomuraea sp. SYSU D8015]